MRENPPKLRIKSNPNNVETTPRRPFSNKNNLLNRSYIAQYDEYNVKNFLPSKIHTNKCSKSSVQGYCNLNSNWVMHNDLETVNNKNSGKMDSKMLKDYSNKACALSVYIENDCSRNIIEHVASTSPVVNIRRLSSNASKTPKHSPNYEACALNVYIESHSSGNIRKHVASTSPVVNVRRLSSKNLEKHLKRCSVIVEDKFRHESKIQSTKMDIHTNNSLGTETVPNVTSNGNDKRCPIDSQVHNNGHVLRTRKQCINYAKLHEGSLLDDETYTNSTPVHNKKRRILDVYEFVPDDDENQVDGESLSNDSVPFEMEMKSVMCKIEKQHRKQVKREKKMAKSNIQKVQQRGKEHLKIVQIKPINISKKVKNSSVTSHTKNNNVNLRNKKKYQLTETNNHVPKDIEDNLNHQPTDVVSINNVPEHRINILQNIIVSERTTTENNLNRHEALIPKVNKTVENETVNIDCSADLNYIKGKFIHVNTRKRKASQSDNCDVISDADIFDTLPDYESLSDYLDFDKVNFNSTPLNSKRNGRDATPWRPSFYSNHNPHFLQYKSTALPSYNQEMVINSSAVEKVYSHCKTPNGSYQSKKMRQSSILSYIDKESKSDSPDIIESSLFDIHELSPLKSSSKLTSKQKSPVDKENKSLMNTPNKGYGKVKRRILGERIDNSNNVLNNITKLSQADTISNRDTDNSFFGFLNLSNSGENENEFKNTEKKDTWLFGKPLRLDDCIEVTKKSKQLKVNGSTREQKKRIKEKVVVQKQDQVEKEVNNDKIGKTNNTEVTSKNQVLCVGLFEDLELPNKQIMPKRYERKTRKRLVNFDEESEDTNPMKKNKNKRTRQENEEADKWAKAFNRMCKEVDKFTLEIE